MPSPAPVIASNDGVVDAVKAVLGNAVLDAAETMGEISITVTREGLHDAMIALRDGEKLQYQQLMEIAGVDYPDRPERFEICYHLLSLTRNHRIRIKVATDEETPVASITDIWPVAGWLEREVFDLYGVLFDGNPDLRRILTDYGFRGHPFRKDFPLSGYVEMRYSEEHKRVIYEPVELAQDFRTFDFMSPWEGAEYILPGDEKAEGEPDVDTPKVTESPKDTGAGAAADSKAAEKSSEPGKPGGDA